MSLTVFNELRFHYVIGEHCICAYVTSSMHSHKKEIFYQVNIICN